MIGSGKPAQSVRGTEDLDLLLDELIFDATLEIAELSPFLAGMVRYHLGWADRELKPIEPSSIDHGKRIRPRLAMLASRAVGGNDAAVLPLAAAIELLHNFTLVHDDIQDQSPLRRHRETVWALWGPAQAINTGDAIYAASRRVILRMAQSGMPDQRVLAIAGELDRVAIEIVAGQVADLQLEGGGDASVDDYLSMISRKTAAIVRYATWAGAESAGATGEAASLFGEFGKTLGLGFQIRDDILGIWGATKQTGKLAADDIRRKKQSLPVILLRNRASDQHREELARLYDSDTMTESSVSRVLELMAHYDTQTAVETLVVGYHDQAGNVLASLAPQCHQEAIAELRSFVNAMAVRTY